MSRFCWICTFLCALFSTEALAQPEQAWRQQADSLFAAQRYRQAALAYERIVYLNPGPERTGEALLRKGRAQKQLQQYAQAQATLERADLFQVSDSLAHRLRLEAALNAYLAGHFTEAEGHLAQLRYFAKDTARAMEAAYLHILTLNELQRWDEARQLLDRYLRYYRLPGDAEALYSGIARMKLKSADKAEFLSTFAPGLGQVYAGHFFKGVASAVLVVGSFAFSLANLFLLHRYALAFGTSFGMTHVFYSGGIRHSRYLAEQHNMHLIKEQQRQLSNFILQQEQARHLR